MAQKITDLVKDLKPYVTRWIQDAQLSGGGGGISTSAITAHALSGTYHTGTLTDAQGPQFLLRDGSRAITGNIAMNDGKTIDGMDPSVHQADANAHHARSHSVFSSSDHTVPGTAALDLVGATAAGVLGKITPSSAPTVAEILKSDSAGGLTLQELRIGTAMTFYKSGNVATTPDIAFTSSGMIAADANLYFAIDADEATVPSTNAFIWQRSSSNTTDGVELMRLNESGMLTVTGSVRVSEINSLTGIELVPVDDLTLNPGSNKVILANGKGHQTASFVSGFVGSGFRLDQGITSAGRTSLTIDDLTVRGRMSVYELLIRQIRATNGSVFVSSTGKVAAVGTPSGSLYVIDTDSETPHGFLVNDVIRAQRTRWNGTTLVEVYQSDLVVTAVTNLTRFTGNLISGSSPDVGMEYVRLGSTSNANRRGSVYITADDDNAPFIDIVDGVTSHADWNTPGKVKGRVGKLTGITATTNEYGIIAGNGFANTDKFFKASNVGVLLNNVDLALRSGGTLTGELKSDGTMWLGTSGSHMFDFDGTTLKIGGTAATSWTVSAGQIASSNVRIISGNDTNARIEVGDPAGPGTAGIRGGDGTTLTGWAIWAGASHTNRGTAPFRVNMQGDIWAESANITGTIYATAGYIGGTAAGWAITSGQLASSNIKLISGASARIEVGSGTVDSTTAGMATGSAGTDVILWAGKTFANRDSATSPFKLTLNGNAYFGSENLRIGTDGARVKMPVTSSLNISASNAAFRWFDSTDIDVTPGTAVNFVGFVGYRNTASATHVVDGLWTSYVGSTNYNSYAARIGLQAGHSDGTTYTDVTLLLVREPGSGKKYALFAGDEFDIDGTLYLKQRGSAPAIADAEIHVYTRNDKFIVAYRSGATTKYRYMDLTSTNANWTYTTTAP